MYGLRMFEKHTIINEKYFIQNQYNISIYLDGNIRETAQDRKLSPYRLNFWKIKTINLI